MRGFAIIGIVRPKNSQNVGTLWRTAHIYGCAFTFTVGRRFPQQASDTLKAWRHTPMFEFADIEDLREHLPFSTPLVGVELDPRAKPLPAFTHPERTCYLLGAEDSGLTEAERAACHHLVEIPTVRPFCLNVATAGAILLHDRLARASDPRTTKAPDQRSRAC
jgi:tRNA G18 (ribose-2'-O)-methylase SpoU